MIHVCPECGYNDVIEDKVISGHKEVINMTDKDREGARRGRLYEWLAPKLSIEERDTLDNLLFCTAEEAARTERERILDAVNILITAWSVDHKDWREFDVGYTSALEQVAGMIRKDLIPESASDQPPDAGKVIEPRLEEHDLYVYDDAKPFDHIADASKMVTTRPVSAEDVETVREYVLSTIGSHHKPRERDILAALDRIAGKEE